MRNGLLSDPKVGVPYCEKYIVMKEGQRLPNHYHVFKSEDIINRAGGDIYVLLWNADPRRARFSTRTSMSGWTASSASSSPASGSS